MKAPAGSVAIFATLPTPGGAAENRTITVNGLRMYVEGEM